MTDDEIRRAFLNFPAVWRRVSGQTAALPEALVLMPRKKKKTSPYLR